MKRVIKRTVSFVLVFMTVFSVFTILPSEVFHNAYVKAAEMFSSETSAAETYTTDDFTYTLIDEYSKVQILSYIGSDTDVVIPDRIDNKKVTSIADSAFREKSITSVVFGQYVESIGNYAFYGCQSLSKLDFSKSSVKTIGDFVFSMSKSLTSVEFPDSLETVGIYTFTPYSNKWSGTYAESNLKSVKFGKNLKSLGSDVFYYCKKLEKVEFAGSNVEKIGPYCFEQCTALKEFNLSGNNATIATRAFNYASALTNVNLSGVENIDEYAFYGCTSLATANLTGTKTIKNYAFYQDSALSTVNLPDIETIEDSAFQECTALKDLSFGDKLKTLNTYAFRTCSSLEAIEFPESLTTLNNSVFEYCSKLTSVKIPDSITKLNNYTFARCYSLKSVSIGSGCTSISPLTFCESNAIDEINISEDNENYTSVDGVVYNKDKTTLVLYPKNRKGEFIVPDFVTTIAERAFENCKLTSVTIGKNVETVGNYAFQNSSSLTNVTFLDNDSIELTVGNNVFYNCQSLSNIKFSNSIKSIGDFAFAMAKSLTNVEFPDSLESLGVYAFTPYADRWMGNYAGSNLKSVKFGKNFKKLGREAFYYCKNLEKVEFTGDKVELIEQYAFEQCSALKEFNLSANNATMAINTFYYASALTTVNISGVETILEKTFYGCSALTTVNLPDTKTVSESSFSGCKSLTEINLPNVKTIGNYAFYECTALTSISLPNVETIGDSSFYQCTALKDVDFGNKLTSLGTYAFRYCSSLETLEFPETLTTINNSVFEYCTKLKSAKIPNSVTKLNNYTFAGCTSLKDISIGSGCTSISTTAFKDDTSLEKITVSEDNNYYASVDGALLNKEKTSIILYPKSKSGEFVIPDTVTSIAERAFNKCQNLTKITIGANVESIGNYAFEECNSLTDVVFKDSTDKNKVIGKYAFNNCRKLARVDFGNAVKSIGDSAFALNKSIETIELPDSVESIGNSAFSSTSSVLKNVKFGKGIKTIAAYAFSQNKNLETVEFTGNNLTLIGERAFYECTALTELNLSGNNAVIETYAFYNDKSLKSVKVSGVNRLRDYAFNSCTALTTVELGEGLETIEGSVFRYCYSLETVTFPESLVNMYGNTFDSCSKLDNVKIPNNLTYIDGYVFSNCSSLKNVTIGKKCATISPVAFTNSTALENITVSEDNTNFTTVDGVLYNKDKTTLVLYPKSRKGEFVVPDTVEKIADRAFENCPNLTEVTVGKNVKTIGNYAFYNCKSLTNVNFGDSVTSIGEYAFGLSKLLTNIELPDSLVSIGKYAFTPYANGTNGYYVENNLESIKFGSGLKTIGQYAFFCNKKLKSINFTGNNLNLIDDCAFKDCTSLTEVDLTGNNLTIGGWAFYYDTALESVTLGSGVKTIRSNAFRFCSAMEYVSIGDDVETIEYSAFHNATSLDILVLGKNLKSVDSTAFSDYGDLTVYCYEDTYGHEYAKGMSNVDIKFIRDNYYVVDLKASAVSSNSVTLSWKKPNGYDSMDHYIIYKNGAKYDETTDQSYTDINLKSGEEYVYGVAAVDEDGIISEEKTVSVTPACTSVKSITLPNNKTDIGGLNKIKITATMENNLSKTGGQGEFKFSRDGKEWKSACTANVQSNGVDYVGYWSLQNVVSGEYSLRFVFTDKDGGQSYKDIKVNVDRTHPAPIDEVTITPMETYISLSWQISVEYDTSIYRIYKRAENETDFELLSEIRNRDTTSYNDKKVKENVTYYYYIVGTDAYGQESLKYDIVSAGLINDTIPPQFIKMTPASNNYIYGSQPFSVVGNDNVGVAKTALYYSTDSEAPIESWTLLDEHNGSSYSQNIDTKVMPNGIVYVVAKLYDAVGNYTYSPKQRYMCDNLGPEQVKNVKCIAVDGTTATLSWSDVSDDDISYFIVECKQDDGTWKNVSRTGTSLGVNLSGLTPEHDYVYRVIGYDKRSNRGTPSEEITVTTLKDTICPKVTKITPDPGYFKSEINLCFTAEDDYRVKSIKIETSTNKETWTTVSEIKASSESAKCTFNYKLDLKDYEEGSLFVRAKVYDSYGNVTENSDLTCYEYVVDRTAPVQVTGITADSGETESGSSFVNISWNAITDDNSFAYYRVYKSNSADGEFSLMKDKVKTVNTYDEDVEFSATYYYKAEAVDLAGNVGEQSEVVSCKVKDDTEKPVIYDLSPADGTRIGKNNNSITVAASDNAKLSNLKIEYKTNGLFSSYQTLKEINGNSKNNCTATVSLPIDELNSGTEVTIKITASDSSGNQADEKTATYTIDKDAPEIKDVKLVEKDNHIFNLSWNCDADDLSHFYIYRKRANDKSYVLYDSVMAESGKASYTYNDNELSTSDKSVIYKIEAFDKCKNSNSVESELVKISGVIAPVPLLDCQSTVVVGSEYMYDATGSTDDTKIVSYSFDFGDGTDVVKNENGKTLHIFSKTGKYKVTLSVTDSDGNTAKLTKEITVTSRELVGTVNVILKDDKGNVLPNTDAYMDLGEDNQQHSLTDSNGLAVFEAPIGTHIVSSYKKDYLPVKQNISVTGKETSVTLILVNEPIVTGDFEIHKMTFDEIVAAGININAAENRNVVKINVTLVYEREPIHSVIYWNGTTAKSDPIYVKTPSGTRKLTPCVIGGSSCSSGSGSGGLSNLEDATIVYVDVPVEFSYLKEFFSVSLHILNHATSDFSLLDNTVTLNVPDGLSVVKTNSSEPKASVYIDEIKGQTQKTIKWILRGDKPGTYDISADFLGMLSYFNEPISAKFVAENPIEVHDASTIDVEVEAANHNYGGKVFYNIIVENKGDFALEGFKWEKLNESYCDEYVDANGTSYEMEKQRTTLNPGEKFVYHCFAKLGGSYKYIDNIIEDVASMGANAKVSLHDVSYFLDKYFEKFPEEGGAYVFYVQDKDGNPISDATVELNSDLIYKTDGEGRVIIEEEDRKNLDSAYLKVSADGYYTYTDKYFEGVQFGSNTKVKLYRVGEFAVAGVSMDGKDVLNSNTIIKTKKTNQDGSPASVTFISKIYGEVSSVDIVQNNKILVAKSKKVNSSEYIYTNTYSVADFSLDDTVYLSITLKSGEIKKTRLNISTVAVTFDDISLKLPEKGNLEIEDCSVKWLNGFSMEFDFDDYGKLSYEESDDGKTLKYEISRGVEYEGEKFKKKHGVLPKLEFSLEGSIELKIKDDGSLVFSKCAMTLVATASVEYEGTTVVAYIPLTMSVKLSVDVGVEVSLSYDDQEHSFGFDMNGLLLNVDSEISAGIGIKCLSAGIYGDAEFAFDFDLKDYIQLQTFKISGNIGLYAKIFFYTEKFPIISGECTVYDRNSKSKAKAYSELVAAAYNADNYSVNDLLLSYNSGWSDEIESGNGNTALLENAYSASKPQIAVCGDKAVMVYQSIDENATNSANALALYYSVYDSTTGKWSKASKLDDNKCADMSYSLTVSGDQIYLVYTQSNSELSENSSITNTVKNIDVYSAKFSFWSNKFENFTRISNNNTYDANPVLKDINSVPTAIWINSSSNNPFLNDGSNSIMMSSFVNGIWSQPQTAVQNVSAVINCDIIESAKSKYLVYTCDKDGDLSTTDDKTIYICNTATGETNAIAEDVETAVSTGEVLNKSVAVWYENGTLMQYDIASQSKTEICDISSSVANGVEIVNDENGNCAIVYTESKNKINALYLDTASGTWSKPVTLVSSDNYIENVESEYINGKLTFTYYDSKVIDDDMNTESKLVTTIADSVSKPVITDANLDYSELSAGKETKAEVAVTNNSFEPTGNLTFTVTNYDGLILGTYTTTDKSLAAGESDKFTVPFTAPEQIVNRCITITVTDSKAKYTSSYDINLGYTDMAVSAEQYIDGGENFIKATVYNRYSYDSPATIEVYNRNTNEVYYTQNISCVSKNNPVTINIPLDKSYVDDSGFVSVRVISKATDYNDFNNTYMFEYYNSDMPDNMVLIGDATLDGRINISDATAIQKHIVKLDNLTENALVAADTDRDNTISIKDATLVQCYVVKLDNYGFCGTYVDVTQIPTVPTIEPTSETPTSEPATEPSTEVTTVPVTEPTAPTTAPVTVPITEPTTAPATEPTTAGKSYVYAKGYTHAYFWNSTTTNMAGAWPGKAMESIGNGLYRIEIPDGATNVVFSYNGANKTVDLTVNVGKLYSNGVWTSYSVEPTTTPTTVYIYAKGYTHAYFWNSTTTNMAGAWPGKAMESVGNGVYRITVPTGATNVVFSNNGKTQTADLTVNAGKLYSNGVWSTYNP